MFLSWSQVHGALTHFPVALLITAVVFDIGSLRSRHKERQDAWRTVSFWMLAGAVVMAVPSLLSGWITGLTVFPGKARAPAIFDWHWKSALATSALTAIVLWWRVRSRDRLSGKSRLACTLLMTAAAGVVSFTGHLGGTLVFGDESASLAESVGGQEVINTAAKPAEQPIQKPATKPPAVDAKLVQLIQAGRKLYDENGCANCHRIAGKGATTAPDLTGTGTRHPSLEWQIAHIKNPRAVVPKSTMPAYDALSEQELKALGAYMVSLRQGR